MDVLIVVLVVVATCVACLVVAELFDHGFFRRTPEDEHLRIRPQTPGDRPDAAHYFYDGGFVEDDLDGSPPGHH